MNGARISHGGERRIPDALSDHHRIHKAVELLEQISDQNRQEKLENKLHAVSLCHIICCVWHYTYL